MKKLPKATPFLPATEGLTEGMNLPFGRSTSMPTKRDVTKKVNLTTEQAQQLLATDFDRYHVCLLAWFKAVPLQALESLNTRIAAGGCEGFLEALQSYYGIPFDVVKAVGRYTLKAEATAEDRARVRGSYYQALQRALKKNGLCKTVATAENSSVAKLLYSEWGMTKLVSLTGRGAKAMMLTTTVPLSEDEFLDQRINLITHPTRVSLSNNLHDQQTMDILFQFLVGAAVANGRALGSYAIHSNVVKLQAQTNYDFETVNGKNTFRPDGLGIVRLQLENQKLREVSLSDPSKWLFNLGFAFFLENDTGTMLSAKKDSAHSIGGKVRNYVLHLAGNADANSWLEPWLLFVVPSATSLKKYEAQVRWGMKQASDGLGFLNKAEDYARIAVATHEDLRGDATPFGFGGGVWRAWDAEASQFTSEKFNLLSLSKREPAIGSAAVVITNEAQQPTTPLVTA